MRPSPAVKGGFQPISRDTDNNTAMFIAGGRTNGANERSFVWRRGLQQ